MDTRKSKFGFIFVFGGDAISWKINKQECIAQSTMETEYIALNLATKEVIYIRILRRNLLMVPFIERLVIMSDNTIAITKDMKCHSKAKHIEGKYYYVSDMLKKQEVWIERVSTKQNLLLDVIAILNKKLEFH